MTLLEIEWVQVRTAQTFRMMEALIYHRNKGVIDLTPDDLQRCAANMLSQPMPATFSWGEARRLLSGN